MSFIFPAQNRGLMPTIKEGGLGREDEEQNPSALPLPKTDGASPVPGTTSKPISSNVTNQVLPPYFAPIIPLPILDPNAKYDDTATNRSIEVVSEDPTEGSYTADRCRKGLDYDSDEGNDVSR